MPMAPARGVGRPGATRDVRRRISEGSETASTPVPESCQGVRGQMDDGWGLPGGLDRAGTVEGAPERRRRAPGNAQGTLRERSGNGIWRELAKWNVGRLRGNLAGLPDVRSGALERRRTMRHRSRGLLALLPLLSVPLWGCGDEGVGIDGAPGIQSSAEELETRATLAVDPFHPLIPAGEAVQLTACWRLEDNRLWPDTDQTRFTWASSDPDVAVVDEHGLVTGRGPGLARITVTLRISSYWRNYVYSADTPVGVK